MASSDALRPNTSFCDLEGCATGNSWKTALITPKDSKFGGWKWEKATHAFTSDDCRANEANRQFAKMMHVKTLYGGPLLP